MKLPLTPIADLKPDPENEIYKIEARISRLWRFQNNGNSGNDGGVDLILVDDKGDRIQACIRGGKLIDKFEKELEEGNCCVLMNFKLSQNLGNFRGTNHPFKIFFSWSTHVKLCEQIPNHSLRFNLISFDELVSQTHDEKVFVDVIGEIIGMKDIKEITANHVPCKLLNLQLKSFGGSIIDCVFWEKYAEDIHSYVQSFSGGPIVLLCSLMRINVYKGKLTIQTGKSSTKLFINSDIAEINQFKEKMPKDVISLTSSSSLLTQVSSDNLNLGSPRTISELLTSHEAMTCSTYATISAIKTEIPWFYLGCPTCSKKVNLYLNPETEEIEADKFTCDQCQKIVNSTVTRYQVHVKVMDDTGTTSLLMFDREVIQLIHKSAYELLEQQVQFNRGSQFPQELLALDGRKFVFTVFKPETSKNFIPTTFKVVTLTDDPVKVQTFLDGAMNTADTAGIGPHFSSSTELTTNLIEDVSIEVSNNDSISGSTESPATTSKKRSITSEETHLPTEDCVASLSAKKLKQEVTPLPEEEVGQLSSTKPKSSIRHVIKDAGAKLSSTRLQQKVSANLIPKKEKN